MQIICTPYPTKNLPMYVAPLKSTQAAGAKESNFKEYILLTLKIVARFARERI